MLPVCYGSAGIQVRPDQSFEVRLTGFQGARAPRWAFGSRILNCIWVCASRLFPWAKSLDPESLWTSAELWKMPVFFLSFSIKHIYRSWLEVLSEEYFIFFLIALFAFNFLNFHGLHGCACRGIFVCTRVGWLFFRCMLLVPWTYDPHKLWEWLARPRFCSCFCSFEE